MALFASSYIPTVAASVTRNADAISFPFGAIPQAMTVYIRWIEQHADFTTQRFLIQIGSLAATNPRFVVDHNSFGTQIATTYFNAAGTTVSSVVTSGLTIGATAEARAVLNSIGSVLLGVSVNGGVESLGSASAALALPQTWLNPNLVIGAAGTLAVEYAAYVRVIITRGVQSLAVMQRLAAVA